MPDYIGSEWRKWDLHIHSPESVLNNRFEGSTPEQKWTKYIDKLRTINDVAVFGITDYWSIDGYKKLIEANRLDNISMLLPNVEMRITPVTGDNSAINIHAIFNPQIADSLDSLFFSNLEFTYQGETYKCIREDLVKLGRRYRDNGQLDEYTAYHDGIEQFKTTINDLKTTFDKSANLKNNTLIFVSNSSNDGASGIQHSSLATTREEIYRFADVIFSSNPRDRNYFLGDGTDSEDDIIRKYDRPKPCVHGSDAHDLDNICNPCALRGQLSHNCNDSSAICELRNCWIKADPTFEGLRQIIFEPRYRVQIGASQPMKPLFSISMVELNFPPETKVEEDTFCFSNNYKIHFSPNLTCFIGGRGTGKSTILHLIKEKLDSNSSDFDVIKKLVIPDNRSIQDCVMIDNEEEEKFVEFISQNEIESLALDNQKLTNYIKSRIIKLDFEKDLIKTQAILKKALDYTDQQIQKVILRKDKYVELQNRKKILQSNIKLLDSIESAEYKELTKHINEYQKRIGSITRAEGSYTLLIKELQILTNDYKKWQAESNKYADEYNKIIDTINGILENSLKIDFTVVQAELERLRIALQDKKDELNMYLTKQGLSAEDLSDISGASEMIVMLRYEIEKIESELEKLNIEIGRYDETVLNNAKENYEAELRKQIEPISKHLDSLEGEVRPIALKYEFDIKKAREDLIEIFKEVFEKHRKDYLEDYLFKMEPTRVDDKDALIEAIKDGGGDLNKTQEVLINILSDDVNFDVYRLLIRKVFNDIDKYMIIRVYYDGKSLGSSSFGQRCTATIVILLSLGNNPIIIDEPEAHLDSSLIANYLVHVIKKRKQSRQIVFATHNANFVVNGDAELVNMLNTSDKRTNIVPTSIENLENRPDLLNLEGGEKAFELRGDKYNL